MSSAPEPCMTPQNPCGLRVWPAGPVTFVSGVNVDELVEDEIRTSRVSTAAWRSAPQLPRFPWSRTRKFASVRSARTHVWPVHTPGFVPLPRLWVDSVVVRPVVVWLPDQLVPAFQLSCAEIVQSPAIVPLPDSSEPTSTSMPLIVAP